MKTEWYKCRRCNADYSWFRVEVVDGVELYGWIHLIDLGCESDIGMHLQDRRPGIPDYTL